MSNVDSQEQEEGEKLTESCFHTLVLPKLICSATDRVVTSYHYLGIHLIDYF